MSALNINSPSTPVRGPLPDLSKKFDKAVESGFSRKPGDTREIVSAHGDGKLPFPSGPSLVGATQYEGHILNSAYVRECLSNDLRILQYHLARGNTQEAAHQLWLMGQVNIGEHLKNFKIDPQLFAKLGKVVNDPTLTPSQMRSSVNEILEKANAFRFLQQNPPLKVGV